MYDSLQPHGLYSPWNSPGQNTGDLPNPGIKPRSPTMQVDSSPAEPQGKPLFLKINSHIFFNLCRVLQAFPSFTGSAVKNPPANAGDAGLIPGLGRSPGGGNGNSLQCSCLGKPMDRGAWQATVHGILKSGQKQLSNSIEFCSLQSTPTFL